jgi:two-component system chemotaxis response regulator CheB
MGPLLLDILQRPLRMSPPVPEDLRIEARLALSAAEPLAPMESIDTLGQPASLVCPECNGPLWYVPHGDSYGYRCHVGHAYSPESMLDEQAVALERALWAALRALKERSMLLEQMGQQARERGHTWMSQRLEAQCEEIRQQAAAVHQLLATGIEPQVKAGPEAILATEAT